MEPITKSKDVTKCDQHTKLQVQSCLCYDWGTGKSFTVVEIGGEPSTGSKTSRVSSSSSSSRAAATKTPTAADLVAPPAAVHRPPSPAAARPKPSPRPEVEEKTIALTLSDGRTLVAAVNAGAKLSESEVKDVFITATSILREVRVINRKLDDESSRELTAIIDMCRARMQELQRQPQQEQEKQQQLQQQQQQQQQQDGQRRVHEEKNAKQNEDQQQQQQSLHIPRASVSFIPQPISRVTNSEPRLAVSQQQQQQQQQRQVVSALSAGGRIDKKRHPKRSSGYGRSDHSGPLSARYAKEY